MWLSRNRQVSKDGVCRRRREVGVALLLTLITLTILAVVVVQFQADAALEVRASRYRLERQQCRYAAESAIIVGQMMLQQYLSHPRQPVIEAEPSVEPSVEPNMLTDPNGVLDPNVWEEVLEEKAFETPPFLLMTHEVTIGGVRVTMEFHDENAKWPMMWLLRSPFDTGNWTAYAQRSFAEYGAWVGASGPEVEATAKLARDVGEPLDLPEAPVGIQVKGTGKIRARKQRTEYTEQVKLAALRRHLMDVFAARWQEQVLTDPEQAYLRRPLEDRAGSLNDYYSIWSTNVLNLNTAPAALLEAAFQQVGLTGEKLAALESYRKRTPLKNIGELALVPGVGTEVSKYITPLCVVRSRDFSIRVDARLGRARYRLQGGLYKDETVRTSERLNRVAVVSGD